MAASGSQQIIKFTNFRFQIGFKCQILSTSGRTQTDGFHLLGQVSPQVIDLVGQFFQSDGNHLSGSHH